MIYTALFPVSFRRGGLLALTLALVGGLVWTTEAARSGAADMTSTLIIGSSRIDVNIEAADWKPSQADLIHWVQMAGEAVATYYGRFPVGHLELRISSFDGYGVRHGMTWGRDGGGLIKISVGTQTRPDGLAEDWMLTHEMTHLAFPSVPDEQHWIEEGIATYVEPIARIQAGQLTAVSMWTDLARDMQKGVPRPEDKGLDHTHNWASTYWGGALFCFLADVQIREQTENKLGLQDALRGILNAGGDIRYDWKLAEAFKVGDHATGTTVLVDLYAKMKDQPMPVDLTAMWKQLGIESDGKTVHLNDDAPLAAIRRAMTSPDTAKSAHPASALRPTAVYAGRSTNSSRRGGES
jgi:hypothetical protein